MEVVLRMKLLLKKLRKALNRCLFQISHSHSLFVISDWAVQISLCASARLCVIAVENFFVLETVRIQTKVKQTHDSNRLS